MCLVSNRTFAHRVFRLRFLQPLLLEFSCFHFLFFYFIILINQLINKSTNRSIKQPQFANTAFSKAQCVFPGFAGSWIGQAMIAEQRGDGEALDLFRHAFELQSLPQACVGYAYHVAGEAVALQQARRGRWKCGRCTTDNPIEAARCQSCHARAKLIPHGYERHYSLQAAVALARYTASSDGEVDPLGHNLNAVVLEQQRLTASALASAQRAMECAGASAAAAAAAAGSTSTSATSASDEGLEKERDRAIRLNVARLLSENKCYAQAIEQFVAAGSNEFWDLSALAYCYYRANQLPASYQVGQK